MFFSNHFEHLRCAKRIHMHKFRDLRHVSTVSRLVKNNVDLIERGRDCVALAQITLEKLGLLVYPLRFSRGIALPPQYYRPPAPASFHAGEDQQRASQSGPRRPSPTRVLTCMFVAAVCFGRKFSRRLRACYYTLFRAVSSRKNLRVCGATSGRRLRSSSSLQSRRKLAASSTSYPGGNSLASRSISRAHRIV